MDRIKEKYNGADFDDKNLGGLIPSLLLLYHKSCTCET